MYIFRTEIIIKVNKSKAGREIGLSQVSMSNILLGKRPCPKTTAYCITKYLDPNSEIEDWFIKIK